MHKKFIAKVLPSEGVYCATGIKDGVAINRFAENIPDLLAVIEELKSGNENVFLALHSFKSNSRKADNALCCRSFFIDLDVGPSSKKYSSQEEATRELISWVEEVGLPQPVVVNSGTGIHAYWVLDEDIPSEIWKRYATKFKRGCLEKLKIDPAPTADAARVMRVPGSMNYKTSPPSPVMLWSDDINVYSTQEFKSWIGEVSETPENIFEGVEKEELDADTKAIASFQDIETVFTDIVIKSLEDKGCNQIKFALQHTRTLSYNQWRDVLSIAQHCLDKDTAIHLISEDHPDYDYNKTILKANDTQDHPHRCTTFEENNPGGCDGCPYRGKITNPLALGRHTKEDSPQNPVRLLATTEEIPPLFPKELFPYRRRAHGGIFITPAPVTDKKGNTTQDEDIVISDNDIWPIKRIYHPIDGACLIMRYILPKDKPREFTVPTRVLQSKDEFLKAFAEHELVFSSHDKAAYFMHYIIRWSQYMTGVDAANQMRTQMGWTEDGNGFVIGERELRRDGKEEATAMAPTIRGIVKQFRPQGTLTEWTNAVSKLNVPSLELHAFGVMCGFGSPLMRFMSTNGVCVGFTGDSGAGKTGVLRTAVSLFGEPLEMTLTGGREQATVNALNRVFVTLKNIMLPLDESSNRTPEELSNLIYSVSNGKGKIREQSNKDMLREQQPTASLIAMLTQNQSPLDKIKALKESPDGELARYIEFEMNKPEAFIHKPSLGSEIFAPTIKNYGLAGPAFIKEVFRIGDDKVMKIQEVWLNHFRRDFGHDGTFRFYENLVACTFAGAEIANYCGLIKFDLDRIYKAVINAIKGIKNEVKINQHDYRSVLGEFQNKNHNNTLIMDKSHVVAEPKNDLISRIDLHLGLYITSTSALNKYLVDRQVNRRMFYEWHKANKSLVMEDYKQRLSTGWPGKSKMSPVSTMVFLYDDKP